MVAPPLLKLMWCSAGPRFTFLLTEVPRSSVEHSRGAMERWEGLWRVFIEEGMLGGGLWRVLTVEGMQDGGLSQGNALVFQAAGRTRASGVGGGGETLTFLAEIQRRLPLNSC